VEPRVLHLQELALLAEGKLEQCFGAQVLSIDLMDKGKPPAILPKQGTLEQRLGLFRFDRLVRLKEARATQLVNGFLESPGAVECKASDTGQLATEKSEAIQRGGSSLSAIHLGSSQGFGNPLVDAFSSGPGKRPTGPEFPSQVEAVERGIQKG
jgi:hypothetical protein